MNERSNAEPEINERIFTPVCAAYRPRSHRLGCCFSMDRVVLGDAEDREMTVGEPRVER